MPTVEFPNGSQIDFDSPEALANAIQHIRAGTPLIVRDEKDGSRAVVWAPEGSRRPHLLSPHKTVAGGPGRI